MFYLFKPKQEAHSILDWGSWIESDFRFEIN